MRAIVPDMATAGIRSAALLVTSGWILIEDLRIPISWERGSLLK